VTQSTHPVLFCSARVLAVSWALFWVWLGFASGIAEGETVRGVVVHTAVPGLFFALLVVVAWRWQTLGGVLLVLAGLFAFVVYPILFHRLPPLTIFLTLLTMAVPPLVAGILLLMDGWLSKPRPA
jgi:hypothetical protein